MKWRLGMFIPRMDTRTVLEQHPYSSSLPLQRRKVQRSVIVAILYFHFRAVFQQELYDVRISIPGRLMEWR
jgi:hypothetical protein